MSFNNTKSTRVLFIYMALVFILSWGLQIMAILTTGDINSEGAELWLVVTMFVPTLLTLTMLMVHKPFRSEIQWKPNRKIFGQIGLAIIIPTLIAFVVLCLVQAIGMGTSGWFTFATGGVTISGGPYLLGTGMQSWWMFVANILITAAAFSFLNAIPAAGEEFAWRGFLQGQLTKRLGITKGIALLGLIWAMWHLPAQLAGYNFPDYPVIGSFLISPLELIGVSLFMGWLTIRSGSFIPAAIAHGAGNSIQEGIIQNLDLTVPRYYEDLITLGVTMAVGLCYFILLKRNERAIKKAAQS
jgi:membrane protease YdiL (CAAX protease family)